MADLINVTPEKLKATASSFQQAGKDVKKTTSDMLQLVRGISSSIWSGEAVSYTHLDVYKRQPYGYYS